MTPEDRVLRGCLAGFALSAATLLWLRWTETAP